MHKIVYISLGLLASALAIIGAYTPGIPTTIFVIVALWAFSKSSQKLNNWFRSIPVLKEAIKHADNYQKHKAVTKKVKIIAQTCAWSSFVLMLVLNASLFPTVSVLLAAVSCSIFMHKVKTLEINP